VTRYVKVGACLQETHPSRGASLSPCECEWQC
jgi:hypothetical protein